MSKIMRVIKNIRIIILLVFLILAVIAIHPVPNAEGVAIRSITKESAAELAGIESPDPSDSPASREVIIAINNIPIKTEEDYYNFVDELTLNRTVQIRTNRGLYTLKTQPLYEIIVLNETEIITVNETTYVNETVNGTTKLVEKIIQKEKEVPKEKKNIIGMEDIGLKVYPAPSNNVRKGLDLQGGTRVLLQPEGEVSAEDMELILTNMKERLNVFGLTDVVIRKTKDLSGNQYILIEIAGANDEEVRELIAKQGKFEAKIANETAFNGGEDVTYVCRSADCSGINPYSPCGQYAEGWVCRFRFSIALSPEAAQKQADITGKLNIVTDQGEEYLEKQLDLYLDDQLVDSLNIGADLKGRAVTDIAISGSGSGTTREAAIIDALNGMKRLQTILITGSLPVKLNIVKTDAVSPILGEKFVKNAILVGALAILAVGIVIFIRYRKFSISLPMMGTMVSEIVLLLGFAALVGWNLDLAAIAGIIIAAGTGVDDQIVIADEVMRGETSAAYSWKQKIKKAFFIIMAAYFTTVVAMIPLLSAGAGLVKGFAFTTIVGVSIGVFLTRPAFAGLVEILLKK